MNANDFDYSLPAELIAQHPAQMRAGSRLLHLDGASGALRDLQFRNLVDLVAPGDVMVFNDTRVIRARLFGRKESGGHVEVLVERVIGPRRVLAMVRASKPTRRGTVLILAGNIEATVRVRQGEMFELEFAGSGTAWNLLEQHGQLPLPPYITHTPTPADEERYQTIYAKTPGAVAAPTAGLHFDTLLFDALRVKGIATAWVTLHVGAGTFLPLREDDISKHVMHAEYYRVPAETADVIAEARSRGGRIIAVGTTTLRTLESACESGTLQAGEGETRLFVTPGYRFGVVDRLVTNFHLPRSTLLMLVSAFGGTENIRQAYTHAVQSRYRFFSYGDAMLIERAPEAA